MQYLAHHGIEGQKWGKKNGPPYPLDYSDHSAAEKKVLKQEKKKDKQDNKKINKEFNKFINGTSKAQHNYDSTSAEFIGTYNDIEDVFRSKIHTVPATEMHFFKDHVTVQSHGSKENFESLKKFHEEYRMHVKDWQDQYISALSQTVVTTALGSNNVEKGIEFSKKIAPLFSNTTSSLYNILWKDSSDDLHFIDTTGKETVISTDNDDKYDSINMVLKK